MSLKLHRADKERKDKMIEIAIPWPNHPDLVFHCHGAYENKTQKWQLDLATVVGSVPDVLRDTPRKTVVAYLVAELEKALEIALDDDLGRTVKVKAARIDLEVTE